MLNEIVIGDVVSDGFEEGMVHSIRIDKGDKWYDVWDGKEGWSMHEREVKLINNIDGDVDEQTKA
jgi:hypothetical protein